MSQVYNTIGCLETLKEHLTYHNIEGFRSVKEILQFQRDFKTIKDDLLKIHQKAINQEKIEIAEQLIDLEKAIQEKRIETAKDLDSKIDILQSKLISINNIKKKDVFRKLLRFGKAWVVNLQIKRMNSEYTSKIEDSVEILNSVLTIKNERYNFITLNNDKAVENSARIPLGELHRKFETLGLLSNYIHGAIGEQKVLNQLKKLPDSYSVINNVNLKFSPPIYYPKKKEYIKSIQIDHLVIGPNGIFLIETKNWSFSSIQNENLYSPINQMSRNNFALFLLLNGQIRRHKMPVRRHHWGQTQVPIRNILAMAGAKPKVNFEGAKMLVAEALPKYILFFEPIYSKSDVDKIANFVQSVNNYIIDNR